MNQAVVPGSFRDPSGFLFTRDGVLYRQVNEVHKDDFDRLMSSGLCRSLVDAGRLLPHETVHVDPADPSRAYLVIRPERIPFVSYPYEWCFSQLKHAALLTLDIQETAMAHDMSLRDASAFNVQFHEGRPVLIDTLSFERLREGEPWGAYGQFCRHFLAPLALMAYRDVRLGRLFRLHIDGVPLDLADALLPRRLRLRPSLYLHLHVHARMGTKGGSGRRPERHFTRRAFEGLVGSLRKAVQRLFWEPESSTWRDYYAEADHYSETAMRHKRELVDMFVRKVSPGTVWDLGGNVGEFARIAADHGARTICCDVDPSCVELNYRRVAEGGERLLLPLLCDLANPSPALGWAHSEREALVDRGPADLIMALALVHHLAIGNNVPFSYLSEFFARIARWLLIEFVPKRDPRVQQLLAFRDDIFDGYTREYFESTFSEHFKIEDRETLSDSDRTVYLMRHR